MRSTVRIKLPRRVQTLFPDRLAALVKRFETGDIVVVVGTKRIALDLDLTFIEDPPTETTGT